MLRSLNTAATGMLAQQHHIDVIANNMANVNTTGFRRARAEFQDLVYQNMRTPGGFQADGVIIPTGIQVGQGTRTIATQALHTQGSLQETGAPLDVAIEGQGFFVIRRPNGEFAYSRAGNFKADAEGRLVTNDGFWLEPEIAIPADATGITVAPDGTVSVNQANGSVTTEIGRFQLAKFVNPGGLEAIGRGQFMPTPASGMPILTTPGEDGTGTLAQGSLEMANVEVVNEMIDLIQAQRAYDINQKVIQASDEILRKAVER